MSAYGATFWRSIDGLSYYQITGLIDLTPPSLSKSTVDDTEPETEYQKKKSGKKKIGDVSITLVAENNPHIAAFVDDFESDDPRFYRIFYGENFSVSFSGFVTSLGDDSPTSSRITRKVTISITEEPTLNNRGE